MSYTPLQRILRVMRFYEKRGQNRENTVNVIYRKIIKQKYEKH